jgi:hypothetical protein
VLSPETKDTAVTQAYPRHLIQKIDQRWQRRQNAAPLHAEVPVKENYSAGGHCPACDTPASIAPMHSGYHGNGLVQHQWLCRACGHEWTTALRVPS